MMAQSRLPDETDVTLAPGEFFFGGGRTRVHTLLGSCVAITLWHPRRHIGGMCHYLLPARGGNARLAQGYYADDAIRLFREAIARAGTRPAEYEVKLFGGGQMFGTGDGRPEILNVSRNNIEHGARLLEQHGFRIRARDVGGTWHRRIYLELWSGDVWVQRGRTLNSGRE